MEIRRQGLDEGLKRQIYEGLGRHAREVTGHDEKLEPVAFVVGGEERVLGAIVVVVFWGALHIKYIYVADEERGKGMGSHLMERALKYGRDCHCPFAFVETMSFQALGFYQKLGFELEFTRPGYSHGTSFHYLRKNL